MSPVLCCACMCIPGYSPPLSARARTQPAGARGFDPSVIDARACRYGCLSNPPHHHHPSRRAHTHTYVRTGAQFIQTLLLSLFSLTHEVSCNLQTDVTCLRSPACTLPRAPVISPYRHFFASCNFSTGCCAYVRYALSSGCLDRTEGTQISPPPPLLLPKTSPHPPLFSSPPFSIISCRAAIRSRISLLSV